MRMCDRGIQMLITTVGAFAAFSLMTIAVGTDYWLYSREYQVPRLHSKPPLIYGGSLVSKLPKGPPSNYDVRAITERRFCIGSGMTLHVRMRTMTLKKDGYFLLSLL
ncbi:hypothetical protein ACRRTK_010906 [Alexandromys fortis]